MRVSFKDRGFASMPRQLVREIASQGGRAAHAKGVAHRWTSEEAREAGRKGGQISRRVPVPQLQREAGRASKN
jgi:general stress protein YciG